MKFFVIGINDNKAPSFSQEIKDIIAAHTVFSGGKRHYEIIKEELPTQFNWIDITVPLEKVFQQYESYDEIVVFASGDPLFFGFANTIQRMLPEAEVQLFPSFNSLQLLAHRILLPYQDMSIVSLTGRNWDKFDEALILEQDKIGVLTDSKEHTPATIAARMLAFGYNNYRITIGELLGNNEKENVSSFQLEEILDKTFAFPNNLLLQKTANRPRPFGIPDNEFHLLNGREKMITKMPVRLLTLSLLDLRTCSVFWDIGFCTGSISIEAKLQFPHLKIIAFEKREEGKELMEKNSRKLGAPGIHSVIDDFTNLDLSRFPAPDAVFIGGHGGKMEKIIEKVTKVLKPNGVIVFNSVSDESKQLFLTSLQQFSCKLVRSSIIKVDDFNAIEVMKAKVAMERG